MSSSSSSDDRDQVTPDSTYPPLEPPAAFRSQIPDHLLVDTTPTDRYIMEQISIMRQHMDWSVQAHLSQDRQLRFTNGKVRKHTVDIQGLKDDKKLLKSGWKVLVVICGAVSGLVSFLALIWQTLGSK